MGTSQLKEKMMMTTKISASALLDRIKRDPLRVTPADAAALIERVGPIAAIANIKRHDPNFWSRRKRAEESQTPFPIRILAIRASNSAGDARDGKRVVAHFDAAIGPVTLKGCAILERDGELVVLKPKARSIHGETHGVVINDRDAFAAIRAAALKAYGALATTPIADPDHDDDVDDDADVRRAVARWRA